MTLKTEMLIIRVAWGLAAVIIYMFPPADFVKESNPALFTVLFLILGDLAALRHALAKVTP